MRTLSWYFNILLLFFTLFFCVRIKSFAQQIDNEIICKKDLVAKNPDHPLRLFKEHNEKEFSYNVVYHRMRWHVNPDTFYIKGSVMTHFQVKEENFTNIAFDLADELNVDSVIFRKQKRTFSRLGNDILQIELGATLQNNNSDSVEVFYQGEPVKDNRAFVQQIHADTAIIWTLSEPYGAKDWWPCKQSLTDKADSIDIFVTTLDFFRAAGNGILVNESQNGNYKTYHWRHRYPIAAYLVGIAVTNYAQYTDWVRTSATDSFPVVNYVYPENADAFRENARRTVPIMQEFIRLFGPYPFEKEKYGHAQFGFGGGMEHQTMSFMVDLRFSLIVHELAHQYFGDKITCGSWHDIWLNEGFASYCEMLLAQTLINETEFRKLKALKILDILEEPNGAVYVDDTTSVSRIFSGRLTYYKGAMVLHMLRYLLGDEAFFQAIRNYLNDPKLSYSFSLTQDLKTHLENTSGKDLDKFFSDWVYGEGYPQYQLFWKQSASGELYLNLKQEPTHQSVSNFDIPVPIRIKYGARDTLIFLTSGSSRNDEFKINFHARVDSVFADPDQQLIAKYDVINIDKFSADEIKLFPNPANNNLSIFFKNPQKHKHASINITDASGRIVLSPSFQNQQVLQINLHELANGLYIVRFESEEGTFVQRFVKMAD